MTQMTFMQKQRKLIEDLYAGRLARGTKEYIDATDLDMEIRSAIDFIEDMGYTVRRA